MVKRSRPPPIRNELIEIPKTERIFCPKIKLIIIVIAIATEQDDEIFLISFSELS